MLGVLLCNLLHFLVYVGRYTPYLVHVPFAGNRVFFPEDLDVNALYVSFAHKRKYKRNMDLNAN